MNPNYEKQLEAEISRQLKNLPELRAPESLVPGVLAAVERRSSRPWYRCSWWQWPVTLRVASAIALFALLAWLPLVGGHLWETSLNPVLSRWFGVAQTIAGSLASSLIAVFRVKSGFGPETLRLVFLSASLWLLVMYFTCVGVGTFVYRTVRR
jgi:hypothetical protein